MNNKVVATLLVTATVFLSACSPLEELPGTATEQAGQNQADQPTALTTSLKSSQLVDGRFFEINTPVHFSYAPPEGWKIQPSMQAGLTSWIGPAQSNGTKSIFVINIEQTATAGKDAFQAFLDRLSPDQYTVEILEQGEMKTQSGEDGYRAVLRVTDQTGKAIFGMYMFSKDGNLLTLAYSRLADEHAEEDAIIDASMQTFRFEE